MSAQPRVDPARALLSDAPGAPLPSQHGSPAAPAPHPSAVWRLDSFAGRLAEISGARSSAALTLAFHLAWEAQRQAEPVAWVGCRERTFFPPDAAAVGVDLDGLIVVWASGPLAVARAADLLVRSGGFGLVVLDLGDRSGFITPPGLRLAAGRPGFVPAPPRCTEASPSSRRLARPPLAQPRAEGRGYETTSSAALPLAALARLAGLALKHGTAVLCLTEKEPGRPSLGPLVSMRAEADRVGQPGGRFLCRARVVKDKRLGPGWEHTEVCRGPDGLS